MPAFFFEVEWLKIIMLTGGALLVAVLVVGTGSYIFLRIFASIANSRRDAWEAIASELGLEVDRTDWKIVKRLTGLYAGHQITVASYGVPNGAPPTSGPAAYDNHISCEASFAQPLSFPFRIISRTRFLQEVTSVFGGYDMEVGLASFDNAFSIDTSDPEALRKILSFEPNRGMQPSLASDMVMALQGAATVEVNDLFVKISAEIAPDDSGQVRTLIEDTIRIASRFHATYIATR